jgi:hypothetical protein
MAMMLENCENKVGIDDANHPIVGELHVLNHWQ